MANPHMMRNGHQNNKRMRGRNRGGGGSGGGPGKGHNPLTRVYESNGPDVKIRGTAHHVAEKYLQLARDAQASGDPVAAENYLQHAEHYFRLIAAAQEQFRQSQPFQRPESSNEARDESYEDGDEDGVGGDQGQQFRGREPQSYQPREQQPFQPREQQAFQPRDQHGERRAQSNGRSVDEPTGLPSFITGGSSAPNGGNGQGGENAQDASEGPAGDRFPLHRRRRRNRGPRPELAGAGGEEPDAGEE